MHPVPPELPASDSGTLKWPATPTPGLTASPDPDPGPYNSCILRTSRLPASMPTGPLRRAHGVLVGVLGMACPPRPRQGPGSCSAGTGLGIAWYPALPATLADGRVPGPAGSGSVISSWPEKGQIKQPLKGREGCALPGTGWGQGPSWPGLHGQFLDKEQERRRPAHPPHPVFMEN